jgi:hypothetical protein
LIHDSEKSSRCSERRVVLRGSVGTEGLRIDFGRPNDVASGVARDPALAFATAPGTPRNEHLAFEESTADLEENGVLGHRRFAGKKASGIPGTHSGQTSMDKTSKSRIGVGGRD